MAIKAVIFDLDGTLLNSLDDLYTSTNYALSTHGYPLRTKDEIKSFVGNGVQVLMTRALPEGTKDSTILSVLNTFKEHYKLHMKDQTGPYPGILSLLSELKKRGIKTAIVSNKFDTAAKQLAIDYFENLIDIAVGESALVPKKPNPTGLKNAILHLNCTFKECLYVGDSDVDMITASNANVTSVGVTWGFRSRELLHATGAVHIIDTPNELLSLCDESNH